MGKNKKGGAVNKKRGNASTIPPKSVRTRSSGAATAQTAAPPVVGGDAVQIAAGPAVPLGPPPAAAQTAAPPTTGGAAVQIAAGPAVPLGPPPAAFRTGLPLPPRNRWHNEEFEEEEEECIEEGFVHNYGRPRQQQNQFYVHPQSPMNFGMGQMGGFQHNPQMYLPIPYNAALPPLPPNVYFPPQVYPAQPYMGSSFPQIQAAANEQFLAMQQMAVMSRLQGDLINARGSSSNAARIRNAALEHPNAPSKKEKKTKKI
ncbi:basic salivary proline-rich protein 1-like [Leptopilina heterotoma]|uniref:basic salivary proline-rich protein 1-like n=1 Tax=Leptopilina heterotoma TaxID=63436 RepID=UPI001CA99634|nr:basic salivary proline-rich protein 1-like [Leptopilina heterotoma]